MEKELFDVTKKSGIVLFGGIFGNIFSLVFNLVAVRLIGVKAYGQYIYIFTVISLIPVIGSLGFVNGLLYSIPKLTSAKKLKERNSVIGFSLMTGFFISVLIMLLTIAQNHWITGQLLNKPELSGLLKALTPLSVFLTIATILSGVFVGTGNIKINVFVQNIITPITRLFFLALLAFFGFKLWGLVTATYISTISGIVLLIWDLRRTRMLSGISRSFVSEYKQLLVFSAPILLANILVNINSRINTYMIGYFLSVKQVAIYNIAFRIGLSSVFIYTVFNSMFSPVISKLYHQGEMKTLSNLYKTITKWMLAGNLIVFTLVLLFSKDILHIFGSAFMSGSLALIIITMGQIVNAGTGSAAAINTMTGHSSYELYCNIILFVFSPVVNYLLIPVWGINGAALTSLVAVCLVNLIRLFLVYRDHRIHPYSWDYLKVIGACALSGLVIWFLKSVIPINWLVKLIALSGLYLILFIGSSILLGLSESDRLVIDKVLQKLPFRRREVE